ncbi:MAG: terminase TerL endonuclease subunit, partial [Parcubacteria group bacterium]
TPELTEVLMTGMGKRLQPLCVHLTTADYEREGSVCNQKHDYAKKVAANSLDRTAGIDDPAFLPVVYEATIQDDWTDPKVWAKANPNLGISVPVSYLEHECKRAIDDLGFRPTFQRLHLNIRTKQRSRWLAPEKWLASAGVVAEEALYGQPCGGGLDLSAKYDLTTCVYTFPQDDGVFKLLPRFWIPEKTAEEQERKNRIPYAQWAAGGFVTVTPRGSVDYDFVEAAIRDDAKRFELRRLAFDPWNANATRTRLEADGLPMVEFGQTLKNFNEPSKEFAKLMIEGKLHHGNHPVLTWCAENVEVYTDASGNIRPVKPKEGAEGKIDGIVGGIMSLWAAMTSIETAGESYYESNPIEFA